MTTLKIVKGDLITEVGKQSGVFVPHIVNSGNAMGAGVAKALFTKWPRVKVDYHNWFDNKVKGFLKVSGPATLGNIQFVPIDEGIHYRFVVNMIGQDIAGGRTFKVNGKEIHIPPIRYQSLEHCMYLVAEACYKGPVKGFKYKIYCPWFGTGLAGGNKEIITEMINRIWVDNGIDVTVVEQ